MRVNNKQWLARRVALNGSKFSGRNQIFTCKFLLKLWCGQIQDCWKPTTWIFEGLNTFETNLDWIPIPISSKSLAESIAIWRSTKSFWRKNIKRWHIGGLADCV